jgi:hypothetical protein
VFTVCTRPTVAAHVMLLWVALIVVICTYHMLTETEHGWAPLHNMLRVSSLNVGRLAYSVDAHIRMLNQAQPGCFH